MGIIFVARHQRPHSPEGLATQPSRRNPQEHNHKCDRTHVPCILTPPPPATIPSPGGIDKESKQNVHSNIVKMLKQ